MKIITKYNLGDYAQIDYVDELLKCQIVQIRVHADSRWGNFSKRPTITYQVVVFRDGHYEFTRTIVEHKLIPIKERNN